MTADQIENVSQAIDDAASAIHNATEWGDPYWAGQDGTTILQRLIVRIGCVVEAAVKEEREACALVAGAAICTDNCAHSDAYENGHDDACFAIREAIRKRGQ